MHSGDNMAPNPPLVPNTAGSLHGWVFVIMHVPEQDGRCAQVMGDHARAVVYMVSDGVAPSQHRPRLRPAPPDQAHRHEGAAALLSALASRRFSLGGPHGPAASRSLS